MQNYPKIFLKIIFVSLFFYGFSLAQTKDTPEKLAQTGFGEIR
jgi:hypothetical protein